MCACARAFLSLFLEYFKIVLITSRKFHTVKIFDASRGLLLQVFVRESSCYSDVNTSVSVDKIAIN